MPSLPAHPTEPSIPGRPLLSAPLQLVLEPPGQYQPGGFLLLTVCLHIWTTNNIQTTSMVSQGRNTIQPTNIAEGNTDLSGWKAEQLLPANDCGDHHGCTTYLPSIAAQTQGAVRLSAVSTYL